jgi:hypothetical protein
MKKLRKGKKDTTKLIPVANWTKIQPYRTKPQLSKSHHSWAVKIHHYSVNNHKKHQTKKKLDQDFCRTSTIQAPKFIKKTIQSAPK